MSEQFSMIDASDTALNVAVRGQTVLVIAPGGSQIEMSIADARRSMQRLADAIAVAEGLPPIQRDGGPTG
ncbi:MAG TPA: hypothetical protein VME40_09545 [Caulobacteraceae bacterium]|nr:hypothetical protein [Caulobacteraceae bacterium]